VFDLAMVRLFRERKGRHKSFGSRFFCYRRGIVVFGDYFPGGSRTGSRGPTRKSRHSRFARNTPEVTTGGDGDSSPRKEKRRAKTDMEIKRRQQSTLLLFARWHRGHCKQQLNNSSCISAIQGIWYCLRFDSSKEFGSGAGHPCSRWLEWNLLEDEPRNNAKA
jgi:hypothetical protein